MSDHKKNTKIKVTIRKKKKEDKINWGKSGPRVNDVHAKASRWKFLPAKNVVKIREKKKSDKLTGKYFYRGIFFVALGIVGILCLTVFYYWQFFAPRDKMVKFIPQETVLYGKVDLDGLFSGGNGLEKKELAGLAKKLDFLKEKLIKMVDEEIEPLGIKFITDVRPFLGDDLALAYLKNGEESGFVFIADFSDRKLAEDTLEELRYKAEVERESYSGIDIIIIKKKKVNLTFYCVFLEDYIVASKNRNNVVAVIDTYGAHRASLARSEDFKSLVPLVLRKKFAHFYIRPAELSEIVSNNDSLRIFWDVFVNKVKVAFVTLGADDEMVYVDLVAQGAEGKMKRSKVSEELIEILPVETSGFVLGRNLSEDFAELKEELVAGSPALEFYFSSLVRRIEERTKVELSNNLLSYFDAEYIVFFDYSGDKVNYNFIFKLIDTNEAGEKMKEIEKAISNYLGNLYPKKEKIILADGSEAYELLPDEESFRFEDLEFEGATVRSIINPNVPHNFAYVILDDKLLASTSLGSLKNILLAFKETNKIVHKRYFNVPYSKISRWKNENVVYLDVGDLTDYLKIRDPSKRYLEPFRNVLFSSFSHKDKLFLKGILYVE
jgi:hypothetical protein